jgi:hypothetical protein
MEWCSMAETTELIVIATGCGPSLKPLIDAPVVP